MKGYYKIEPIKEPQFRCPNCDCPKCKIKEEDRREPFRAGREACSIIINQARRKVINDGTAKKIFFPITPPSDSTGEKK